MKSYDELKGMIERTDDGRRMRIVCRKPTSDWVYDGYVVHADLLSDDDGVDTWHVSDPNTTELYTTEAQAIDAMIDMADLFFTAEDTRRQDEEHQP